MVVYDILLDIRLIGLGIAGVVGYWFGYCGFVLDWMVLACLLCCCFNGFDLAGFYLILVVVLLLWCLFRVFEFGCYVVSLVFLVICYVLDCCLCDLRVFDLIAVSLVRVALVVCLFWVLLCWFVDSVVIRFVI